MCGYNNDASPEPVTSEALISQFKSAMEKFDGYKMIKIFNSGSFFDEREVPLEARTRILEELNELEVRVVIESRPEFITETNLEQASSITKDLEIAIGLETANGRVNKLCINKGFGFEEYTTAARLIRKHGLRLRTYLLLKPPFLTEKYAIEDVWGTMEKIRPITDVISINPVNVQKGTLVEKLWKNGQYRPPWLWSIFEIFGRMDEWKGEKKIPYVISHPSGAGTKRGIHNCLDCDRIIIEAISKFSQTQDQKSVPADLKSYCDCHETWLDLLELEHFTFTATGKIY